MAARYQVSIFGKEGCDKCQVLKQRVGKLLEKSDYADTEAKYYDVETVEGICTFCEAECINPQRIPAMLVARADAEGDEFEPVVNPNPGVEDAVCGKSRLYQYQGLQTDYTKGGVITPKMIKTVLADARA